MGRSKLSSAKRYKSGSKRKRRKPSVSTLFFLFLLVLILAFIAGRHIPWQHVGAAGEWVLAVNQSRESQENPYASSLPLTNLDWKAASLRTQSEPLETEAFRVHPGDTVASILSEHLSPARIYQLSRKCRDVYPLRRIKSGNEYRLIFRGDQLHAFEYDIDEKNVLRASFRENQIRAEKREIQYDTRYEIVQNSIDSSLFGAVNSAGGTDRLAIDLADIYAWDIDFLRDIRAGDSFKMLVTRLYRRGEFVGYGSIKAARFVNRGDVSEAFLYETEEGSEEYFTPEGEALRSSFLKAPLEFTRISSGYTLERRHPVTGEVRPHRGIDYAAPRGTPVKSVAKGRIVERNYCSRAGNYLKVRHPNGYKTLYLHFSRFAEGMRPGREVEQGQVIGYVGSTGVSTGPHLCFRVKKNGRLINPDQVESKPVKSIPEEQMEDFQERLRVLRAAMEGEDSKLASLQPWSLTGTSKRR